MKYSTLYFIAGYFGRWRKKTIKSSVIWMPSIEIYVNSRQQCKLCQYLFWNLCKISDALHGNEDNSIYLHKWNSWNRLFGIHSRTNLSWENHQFIKQLLIGMVLTKMNHLSHIIIIKRYYLSMTLDVYCGNYFQRQINFSIEIAIQFKFIEYNPLE